MSMSGLDEGKNIKLRLKSIQIESHPMYIFANLNGGVPYKSTIYVGQHNRFGSCLDALLNMKNKKQIQCHGMNEPAFAKISFCVFPFFPMTMFYTFVYVLGRDKNPFHSVLIHVHEQKRVTNEKTTTTANYLSL